MSSPPSFSSSPSPSYDRQQPRLPLLPPELEYLILSFFISDLPLLHQTHLICSRWSDMLRLTFFGNLIHQRLFFCLFFDGNETEKEEEKEQEREQEQEGEGREIVINLGQEPTQGEPSADGCVSTPPPTPTPTACPCEFGILGKDRFGQDCEEREYEFGFWRSQLRRIVEMKRRGGRDRDPSLCLWKSKAFTDEAWHASWEAREGNLVGVVSKDGSLKIWRVKCQTTPQQHTSEKPLSEIQIQQQKKVLVDLVFQLVGARYQPVSYVKFRPRSGRDDEDEDVVFMFGRSHADVAVLLRRDKIDGIGVGADSCLRMDEERASRDIVPRSFVRRFGSGFWLNETVFWSSSIEFEMKPTGIVEVFCLMTVNVSVSADDDVDDENGEGAEEREDGGETFFTPSLEVKHRKIRLTIRKRDGEDWNARQDMAFPIAASRDFVFFCQRWRIHRVPMDRFFEMPEEEAVDATVAETDGDGDDDDDRSEIIIELTDGDFEEVDLFGGTENHVYISTTEVSSDRRFLVMNYKPVVIPTDKEEIFQLSLKGQYPPVENSYRLLLYDLVNEVAIQIVTGHRTIRYECLFPSTSGEYLASGSMCENVFCWDARYGIPVLKTKAHDLSTNVATCAPEGTPNEGLLLTVGDDGHVAMWSIFRPDCVASSSPPEEEDSNVDDDI